MESVKVVTLTVTQKNMTDFDARYEHDRPTLDLSGDASTTGKLDRTGTDKS